MSAFRRTVTVRLPARRSAVHHDRAKVGSRTLHTWPCSGEYVRDDVAEHVALAEVAAGRAVGQLLVIDAELVKDGRVEIMDRHAVLHRLEAEPSVAP